MGWGLCTVAGVAGKGETLDVDPALADPGPPHRRLVVRRGQGRDQVPELIDRSTWPARST